MQDNPERAMKIVADVNNIAPAVAKQEFEETYMRLSKNGVFTSEQVKLAMELAVIGGFKDLAPQAEITTDKFVPIG
jgi:NitT/TauT family transport system substrate-binding protein